MSLERLMQIAANLEPSELADIIDLADYYRARHNEAERGQALLARISGEPGALASLESIVQAGRDAVARGNVVDGPAALAAMRTKYGFEEPQA